jgi:hypothetical protein
MVSFNERSVRNRYCSTKDWAIPDSGRALYSQHAINPRSLAANTKIGTLAGARNLPLYDVQDPFRRCRTTHIHMHIHNAFNLQF